MLFDELEYRLELDSVVERFKKDISTLKTGKASKDMFENIMVSAYDTSMPVSNLASLVFEGAISVTAKVFDKGVSGKVWEALRDALPGASVVDQGDVIRINFRPITQEDRDARVKELNKILEEARIAARLKRQDFMQKVKGAESVSEDEQKLAEKDIQEILDEYVKKIEEISTEKEIELSPNK